VLEFADPANHIAGAVSIRHVDAMNPLALTGEGQFLFVLDPLAMTVGADPQAVRITLDAIEMIRDELGVNMCLGASNVSFGLPERHTLNAAFLAMGSAHGLTSAIMNGLSEECVRSVRASDLMLGKDEWGANWIAAHRARQAAVPS